VLEMISIFFSRLEGEIIADQLTVRLKGPDWLTDTQYVNGELQHAVTVWQKSC